MNATGPRILALRVLLMAALCLAGASAQASVRIAPEDASAFIQEMAAQTLDAARGTTSQQELEARMRPLLDRGFELALIGRFVLGRFAREASAAELAEFQCLYPSYLLKAYAGQLDRAREAELQALEVKPVGERDQLVTTRLGFPTEAAIEAKWRVRRVDGLPKVIDVFFEGVSLALTQREEFASVIKREGFAGLLVALRRRTQAAEAVQDTSREAALPGPAVRFLMRYDGDRSGLATRM